MINLTKTSPPVMCIGWLNIQVDFLSGQHFFDWLKRNPTKRRAAYIHSFTSFYLLPKYHTCRCIYTLLCVNKSVS